MTGFVQMASSRCSNTGAGRRKERSDDQSPVRGRMPSVLAEDAYGERLSLSRWGARGDRLGAHGQADDHEDVAGGRREELEVARRCGQRDLLVDLAVFAVHVGLERDGRAFGDVDDGVIDAVVDPLPAKGVVGRGLAYTLAKAFMTAILRL